MRALIILALSALSAVSANLLTVTAPPGTPCPYSSTSFDMTQGTLNRFKFDYSGNAALQLSSCDVALRCPSTSDLMVLFVSASKGGNTNPLAVLSVNVNQSRASDTTGTTVAISTSMAIPLTSGEGVGITIWGDTGYAIIQATCHTMPATSTKPTTNSQVNYLAPATGVYNGAQLIPTGTNTITRRRRYAMDTNQAFVLTCSSTNYGDLNYGTGVVQIDKITGEVGSDDTMSVIATDSNIGNAYTVGGAANASWGNVASTDRTLFQVSSAYVILWKSGGATSGDEQGFTIHYDCRNATGFTVSGAGAATGSSSGSGAVATFSAAVVAIAACLLA